MSLELSNVMKTFARPDGEVRALSGVSLEVKKGEFVAVRGPSGSGKTTLLLCAGGLMAPDGGRVRVAGEEPYALSPEKRALLRARHVGFVFQQFHLVPYLNVMENVLVPHLACPSAHAWQGGSAAPAPSPQHGRRDMLVSGHDIGEAAVSRSRYLSEARARAGELIERFGLSARANHVPAELSTGERQRVALARALLNGPAVLFADEPTGNLDGENSEEVLSALREFADGGGTVLLVTHDLNTAGSADRTLMLESGRLTG